MQSSDWQGMNDGPCNEWFWDAFVSYSSNSSSPYASSSLLLCLCKNEGRIAVANAQWILKLEYKAMETLEGHRQNEDSIGVN